MELKFLYGPLKALDQYNDVDFFEEFCSSESESDNGDFFSETAQSDCSSESEYDNEDFFSETVQSDDLFFFGEDGEEALVENAETYSTAVDDEHDLDLIYE